MKQFETRLSIHTKTPNKLYTQWPRYCNHVHWQRYCSYIHWPRYCSHKHWPRQCSHVHWPRYCRDTQVQITMSLLCFYYKPSSISCRRQVIACPAQGPPQLILPWLNSRLAVSMTSLSNCSWFMASVSVMAGRVVKHTLAKTYRQNIKMLKSLCT